MKFTYLGQSGCIVEVAGFKLLFDPFITGNPLAKDIQLEDIEADFLFISHGHGDHITDAAALAKSTGALVIACPEVLAYLSKQGVEKTHPINHGGPIQFDFGSVRAVNAIHSSGLPDGSYGGNPLGFVIKTNEGDFYFAGDTALTLDMQLIARWAELKFSVLPIGGNYTMDYKDAADAADFVNCDTVIGVHYNTFPYIAIDTDKATAFFDKASKKLLLPKVGETISL